MNILTYEPPTISAASIVAICLSASDKPWVLVSDVCAKTGLTRREVRHIASELGLACGNQGIALMDRLTPEEQQHAFYRVRSQAMSMLKRAKKMRQNMKRLGTYTQQEFDYVTQ